MKKRSYLIPFLVSCLLFVVVFAVTRMAVVDINNPPDCANSKSCLNDLSVKIENNNPGIFAGQTVIPPIVNLAQEPSSPVLGFTTEPGDKRIYIDLSTQTLSAYQGPTQILKTFVSSGKWGRTPTGNFNVWLKLRSTRMTGGQGNDYYDLPNVQYTMFYYRDYALHQAYWHNNFGHVMSHGCVNMRLIDSKALFEWADGPDGKTKGTPVSVCDRFTESRKCIQNNPIN